MAAARRRRDLWRRWAPKRPTPARSPIAFTKFHRKRAGLRKRSSTMSLRRSGPSSKISRRPWAQLAGQLSPPRTRSPSPKGENDDGNWRDVFDEAFGRNDKHRVRNFTSTALEARNATSHLSIPLQDDEALRYLDAMHQLLKAVKAPAAELAELKTLYEAQRHSGMPATPAALAAESAAPARPTLSLGPRGDAEGKLGKALRPWIEVALPHPDVLANRFMEAEFAADLFAVDAGHATEDYAAPENFFRITFLTEGLRRVLTTSLQRLAGSGGDPVVGLQTAFGGGKTHTMLAVYHLPKATD